MLTAAGANANPGLGPGLAMFTGGTDMALGNDPNYVVVTGHNNTEEGTLRDAHQVARRRLGGVSKAAPGAIRSSSTTSAGVWRPGTGHGGGYALACGTRSGAVGTPQPPLADCNAGKGDTRPRRQAPCCLAVSSHSRGRERRLDLPACGPVQIIGERWLGDDGRIIQGNVWNLVVRGGSLQ